MACSVAWSRKVTQATADGTAYVDHVDAVVALASFHTSSQPFVAAVVCRDSYTATASATPACAGTR